MSDGVQAVLDDPSTKDRVFEHPYAGRHSLEDAIGMFFLGDVLVHTWDLARATGQEETPDGHSMVRTESPTLPEITKDNYKLTDPRQLPEFPLMKALPAPIAPAAPAPSG